MRNSKRAQTELIGLVVIVLLITLGLLFYLRFMRSPSDTSVKQEFTDKKLASSTLSVILRTTPEDMNTDLSNLFKRCDEGERGSDSPCDKAKDTTQQILGDTLGAWNREYRFTAKGSVSSPNLDIEIKSDEGECRADSESETFFISTSAGLATLRLDICR
ncbi:hypothetical protein KY320_02175 [Candidatus Woesearchaeota archaeon]|nr:hypothetical protein [Candidatus Woesearchaeota archaeon]